MVKLQDKQEHNQQRTLRATSLHGTVTRYSTVVSNTQAAVAEIRDDESECTSRNIEIRENLIVRHPVEGFAKINHCLKKQQRDSGRIRQDSSE